MPTFWMSFKIKPKNFAKRLCNCLVLGMNLLNMGFKKKKKKLNLVTEFLICLIFLFGN